MHRNTFIFVLFLAVFAAIVAGVNIGKIYFHSEKTPTSLPTSPTPKTNELMSWQTCNIAFSYPQTFTKIDIETGGVTLINRQKEEETILILCQEKISELPNDMTKKETVQIGTVSAQRYYKNENTKGQSKQRLTFIHPKTKKYIYISGAGTSFEEFIKTLQIIE